MRAVERPTLVNGNARAWDLRSSACRAQRWDGQVPSRQRLARARAYATTSRLNTCTMSCRQDSCLSCGRVLQVTWLGTQRGATRPPAPQATGSSEIRPPAPVGSCAADGARGGSAGLSMPISQKRGRVCSGRTYHPGAVFELDPGAMVVRGVIVNTLIHGRRGKRLVPLLVVSARQWCRRGDGRGGGHEHREPHPPGEKKYARTQAGGGGGGGTRRDGH